MPKPDPALADYLATRRSVPAIRLAEPGPDDQAIETMLTAASRVPDHGKLAPWRFIVFRGAVRERVGAGLAAIAERRKGSPLSPDEREAEETRLTRAPVVIAIVSKAGDHPKIPEWEQILSAGAVGMLLFIAANAAGYSANWLTDWFAYDEEARRDVFQLQPDERFAGFMHIGSADFAPPDRPRPALSDIVTWAE